MLKDAKQRFSNTKTNFRRGRRPIVLLQKHNFSLNESKLNFNIETNAVLALMKVRQFLIPKER